VRPGSQYECKIYIKDADGAAVRVVQDYFRATATELDATIGNSDTGLTLTHSNYQYLVRTFPSMPNIDDKRIVQGHCRQSIEPTEDTLTLNTHYNVMGTSLVVTASLGECSL